MMKATKSFLLKSCFHSSKALYSQIEIVHSDVNDIYFNLAIEENLYEHTELKHPILFLWRNDKTVVIGRHQNPFKECHLQKMEEDGVKLSRRRSGGGAVYHDLGNTCFSFLTPVPPSEAPLNSKTTNNEILIKALHAMGFPANVSGRNDILTSGQKISGSAYQISLGKADGSNKKCLHHGTMLIKTDPTTIARYLNPNKEKLKSKGVDSVVSRVTYLQKLTPEKPVTHDDFCNALSLQWKEYYKGLDLVERRIGHDVGGKVENVWKELGSWNWLYGNTPKFTNNVEKRFDWGVVDVYVHVEQDVIVEGKIYSDCLFPEFIEGINEIMSSKQFHYSKEGIQNLMKKVRELPITTDKLIEYSRELEEWLIHSI